MLHRAFSWLLPAVLALGLALPLAGADRAQASVVERGAECGKHSNSIAPINQDDESATCSQWSNDDDGDRGPHANVLVLWTPVAYSVLLDRANPVLPRAHPTSAAYPRGPPSV
jgi:hypothetical protein